MKLELNRLVRLTGCGALLCGGLVLAQDAAPAAPVAPAVPAAPAAPAVTAPVKREMNPAMKELRTQIEAKEKALLEKNADLAKEVGPLTDQIKAKRAEGTPEAQKQVRELSKQRQDKIAAVDTELKELYAKLDQLRVPFGKGQGGARKELRKEGKIEAKPEVKPEAKPVQ